MPVERYKGKRRPISFEEMYRLLLKREARGQAARGDEHWELWGYGPEVKDVTVRQRKSDFTAWLKEKHGLKWDSTVNTRLYPAGTVEPKRKPKKAPSSFDPST